MIRYHTVKLARFLSIFVTDFLIHPLHGLWAEDVIKLFLQRGKSNFLLLLVRASEKVS